MEIINNQEEINIGFLNIQKNEFEKILETIKNSSFSEKFSYVNRIDYDKYSKYSFKKNIEIKESKKEENNKDNNDNIIMNLLKCEANLNDDKKKSYFQFLKEKIDFFLIFEPENIDNEFFKIINEFSNENHFIFNSYHNSYSDKILDDFLLINDKSTKNNMILNFFEFDRFLLELNDKYLMFKLFLNYSVEKNIIKFKDYLSILQKYNQIYEEKDFIELFNRFEKFSFNNDYSDNTLILLQIMIDNKGKFNKGISFNVKSLKCGFCTEKSNICEFDTNLGTFLCYRCRYNKNLYNEKYKQ